MVFPKFQSNYEVGTDRVKDPFFVKLITYWNVLQVLSKSARKSENIFGDIVYYSYLL